MTARQHDTADNATVDLEFCTPPCAYARALMWAMGIGVLMMAAMCATWRSNDRAVLILQQDVKYIRQTLDEVRATQATLLRRDMASHQTIRDTLPD